MQDAGLQNNKWLCYVIFNLDFDGVRLVLGNGRHSEKICGSDEEVAVERRHPQVYGECINKYIVFEYEPITYFWMYERA